MTAHTTPDDPTVPSPQPDSDTERAFGPSEWGLMAGLALTWGASFLFIAVALDDFPPAAITFLRIAFGAATLLLIPAARRPLPGRAWRRIAPLGILQIALPLMLFPIAQQHVSSALAGMFNGTVPVITAVLAVAITRRLPPANQRVGVAVGLAGIVGIAIPSLETTATTFGTMLLVLAVLCYGLAINLGTPLQRSYGALPVILRAQLIALVLTAPLGVPAVLQSTPRVASVTALAVLGCAGTGLAFAALTTLAGRVGATRGSVAVYLTPAVAIALGLVVLDETVAPVQVLGTVLAVTGAWLTSRPSRAPGRRADLLVRVLDGGDHHSSVTTSS